MNTGKAVTRPDNCPVCAHSLGQRLVRVSRAIVASYLYCPRCPWRLNLLGPEPPDETLWLGPEPLDETFWAEFNDGELVAPMFKEGEA